MTDAPPFPDDPYAMGGFRLGDLHVNPATGAISGRGGTEQVDPKVMQVLTALAGSPGELVTRVHLLEGIWPGGVIYDDTLTQCVYQLRQHLARAGGSNKYRRLVKTLPKRGYVLDSDVLPDAAVTSVSRSPIRRPHWWSLALPAALLVGVVVWWVLEHARTGEPRETPPAVMPLPNAIAVLPFINDTGDEALDYLGQGISDELRDRIAALRELRVVARRSSMQFSDSIVDTREIGRQLGVGRLVEGRFSRVQGRVVVTVELVDAVTGFQLWSTTYDRSNEELELIERALAIDVIGQLLPRLASEFDHRPVSPDEFAVRELVLRARQYEQQVTEEQRVDEGLLEKVIALYRQATEINPDSAEAQARLGRMLLYQGSVTEAEPHILRALQLDPERADTFVTLGLYYWAVREAGIGAAFRRAIELNPSDADALSYFASWTWLQGNADQAVVYYRAALQVDPLALVRHADLGYKLAFQGSRHEALAVLDHVIHRFPAAAGYLVAARITEALGDLDEAIAWALEARQARPGDVEAAGLAAELLARLGAFDAATALEPEPGMGQLFWQRRYPELVELGEELSIDRPDDTDLAFLLAFAYSAVGRRADAVTLLEAAGMPGLALSEARRANDLHALHAYLGDLQAVGRGEDARKLAKWAIDFNRSLLASEGIHGWLPHLTEACALSVLGAGEQALAELEQMTHRDNLPNMPWLQDLSCFDPLKNEPRYLSVVAGIEARISSIRARIPETLARHGLSSELPGRD